VRFAVGLPNLWEYADPRVVAELARRAEAAGWDGLFVWDHLAYREAATPAVDPWIATAAVAAATERLRLGVLVCALARRRPWKVARETAALDLLSGGRLVFGVGLGSLPQEEFEAFGEDPDARVRADKVDEGLAIVRGLWSGEPFEHHGEHYRVEETVFRPTPLQRPRIPVWVAGRWPAHRPFRRAAQWDGVFPTHRDVRHAETMTVGQLREIVEYVERHRERPADPFDVILEGQTEGRDAAADAAGTAAYGHAGLTWWIEKLGPFRGPPEYVRDRIDHGPPS
jgi:alkanesulfonate monooxygenase SsuD/methylene tetrahydromethanopterin reductase-like flavin-dependent oxidoreductase (luciferase family)